MASIVSTGIGSGLDVNSLVTQLVEAEKKPQITRLDAKEAALQARLSAFGALKSAIASVQSSLSGLTLQSTYRARSAVSSNSEVLTAAAVMTAAEGRYQISLAGLAAEHKLATDPVNQENARFASVTDVVGTGTLTFKFGTTAYDAESGNYTSFAQNADKSSFTVEVSDGSLRGVCDAINAADHGVSASIIFDGSYYRLALSANDTGAANSMEISVADDDGNNTDAGGLSLLAFNSGASHMAQTQEARNTDGLTIDGIAIDSASNTLSNTVNGLTIHLLEPGSSTLTVAYDKSVVGGAVRGFVEKYNGLVGTINELSKYDPGTGKAGLLNGDGVLRSIDAQIRRVLGQAVPGLSGPYRQLADVGVTLSPKDGTLVLDEVKLQSAIDNNFDAIAGLFAAYGSVTDSLIAYRSANDATRAGNYSINVSRMATHGMLVGSQAASLNVTAGSNDVLSFEVDGITASITLSAMSYASAAALATEIQSRLNGNENLRRAGVSVKVSEADGVLTVTSDTYGSTSQIRATGGNGRNSLLGSAPVSSDGVDVAGTIGGIEATGSGQILTGAGDAAGLELRVLGGSTGSRGNVAFSRGYAEQIDRLLGQFLAEDGIFGSVADGINRSVRDIAAQRDRFDQRMATYEERIRAQFAAMDKLVARMRSTSDFLTSQLASLTQGTANNSG